MSTTARKLYYGSYKAPRTLTWTIGTVILILMMATALSDEFLPFPIYFNTFLYTIVQYSYIGYF